MNVKLQLLSVGAVFFLGTALHAQKAKKDTAATKDIEEVVVVAYGKQKKNAVVGSNLQIDAKKLENRPISNVTQALDGAGPGIQVASSTGQPGSSLSVRIRGISSYNFSTTPLYVVDGAVYNGSLNAINPADIESMNVLKDAAATSLYGSSAANGVVLITTKSGKKGRDKISFSSTTGVSMRGTPEYDRVNAAQYYPLVWEEMRNGRRTTNPTEALSASNLWASNNLISGNLKRNVYNVADNLLVVDGVLNPNASLLYNDFDWGKPLMGTGVRQEYNLSVSGGTDKTTYYTSLGYLNEDGYLLKSGFERFTLNMRVDSQIKSWLKIGGNLAGVLANTQNSVDGANNSASYINPYAWTRTMGPIYSPYKHDAAGNRLIDPVTGEPVYDYGTRGADAASGRNVILETMLNNNNTKRHDIRSRVYAEISLLPYLKLTTNASYDFYNSLNKTYGNKIVGDYVGAGSVSKTNNLNQSLTWNQMLKYNQTFGDHNIDAFVAHENQRQTNDYTYNYRTGQVVDNNYELSNFATAGPVYGNIDTYTKESWFGRVNYGFANKYFLQGSIRWDASSKFASNLRWHSFWSAGANWIISNENFLKGNSIVNYLKLSGSYGQVGNDNVSSLYAYQTLFGLGTQYNNVTEPGTLFSQLADPRITWESNNQSDVSLDFGLFNNRITGSAAYYKRFTKNMLFPVPLPVSAGVPGNSISQNLGDMQNTGWEFSLNGDVIKNQDFTWNLYANASFNKNVIKKLPLGQPEIINGTKKLVVGGSIYDYWVRQWYGVDSTDGSPLFLADDKYQGQTATDLRTVDGKLVTTNYSKAKYGWSDSANPDFWGSFGTNIKIKNWDIAAMFTYQVGGKIYDNAYAGLMSTYTQGGAWSTDILNRWTTPGQVTNVPQLNSSTSVNANAASSRWLVSGSYVQLRSATVGYNFSKELISQFNIDGLRLYISGENLWSKTARKGLEPGGGNFNGTTAPRYTPARIFTFGANVSF